MGGRRSFASLTTTVGVVVAFVLSAAWLRLGPIARIETPKHVTVTVEVQK